jgi:hypothetical protein
MSLRMKSAVGYAAMAALASLHTLSAAEPPPDVATTEKLVAAMREAALAYDSRLPDFICTQITHREEMREPNTVTGVKTSGSRGGMSLPAGAADSSWKSVDSMEQQLTYFGHRETYKLVAMNGKRVAPGQEPEKGLTSTGEFGSTLGGIFDPLSHAEFQWKRWDKLRGQSVFVFTYSIAKENSSSILAAGTSRLVVAYHGLIFVERETNSIVRVTTVAEVPQEFPLQNVTRELDYGRAAVGGQMFLLPLHSEMESRASEDFMQSGRLGGASPLVTLRNKIDFKAFRKYGVDSELKPE